MREPLPTAAEIEQHLELAARGVAPAHLDDVRWESLILAVARRGVVTAGDRRAASRLLAELAAELDAEEELEV
ncbi:hypothetical protein [Homoserinibacter gongjuensis]|uniref:Uncharacterized protein n=1 Tax=Homoserinibacter gongjuensis TaxID=1162968 RepID=A0ABQ6JTL0_9MICO|nr:hypothetical protein [Homoserinibacter gongjuensis]GMA90738.1 hypothetical protein GCM10025869_12670 [Homoserinibacter gongjuensis]